LQAERARLVAAASRARDGAIAGKASPPAAPDVPLPTQPAGSWRDLLADPAHRQRALHPYLGFVYDPAINGAAERRWDAFPEISPEGFYVVPGQGTAANGPATTVGVFGGSMAMLVALEGRDALVRELAASRALGGRRIVIRCYALGGYKQPQQLLALAYLLSLGERPDLVINLDGVNEVALPYMENRHRGVFPYFPRSWDALVQGASNPAALEQAGLVAYLRSRRVRLARSFSALALRRSSSANLLWRALDRRLELQIARANLALAQLPAGAPSFAATGPRQNYATEEKLFADLARHWRTSSLLMSRLAAGHGIGYYHFLQPNQFDPGAKPIGRAEAAVAADPASPFREPVLQGYPLLARAGEELRRAGVKFQDLRPIFSRLEKPLYIDTCCHVNREGNALLGAAIGRAIRQDLDALPRPAGAPSVTGSSR
jgi:hypothetical protein